MGKILATFCVTQVFIFIIVLTVSSAYNNFACWAGGYPTSMTFEVCVLSALIVAIPVIVAAISGLLLKFAAPAAKLIANGLAIFSVGLVQAIASIVLAVAICVRVALCR